MRGPFMMGEVRSKMNAKIYGATVLGPIVRWEVSK